MENIAVNKMIALLGGLPVPDFTSKWSWGLRMAYKVYALITDFLLLFWAVSFAVHATQDNVRITDRCLDLYAIVNCIQGLCLSAYLHWKAAEFGRGFNGVIDVLKESLAKPEPTATIVPLVLFFGEGVPGFVWCLLPLLPWSQQQHGGKFFVGPAWFPFDPFVSPLYEVLVVWQAAGALLATVKIVAFYDLLLHLGYGLVTEHIKLRKELRKAVAGPRELGLWVARHQEVVKTEQKLQRFYSPAFLMHFFFQMMIICTTAFVFAKGELDKVQMSVSSSYIAAKFLKFFFICRMGDHISFESGRIGEEAFGTDWYACSKRVKTSLNIIFCKTASNLKLNAMGVFPLGTETFRAVIATAYSYFTFLDKLNKG